MGVIQYFILCVVIGVIIWLIHAFTPISAAIKKLVLWVGVILLILILCHALGLFGHDIQIPKLK